MNADHLFQHSQTRNVPKSVQHIQPATPEPDSYDAGILPSKKALQDVARMVASLVPEERAFINAKNPSIFNLDIPDSRAETSYIPHGLHTDSNKKEITELKGTSATREVASNMRCRLVSETDKETARKKGIIKRARSSRIDTVFTVNSTKPKVAPSSFIPLPSPLHRVSSGSCNDSSSAVPGRKDSSSAVPGRFDSSSAVPRTSLMHSVVSTGFVRKQISKSTESTSCLPTADSVESSNATASSELESQVKIAPLPSRLNTKKNGAETSGKHSASILPDRSPEPKRKLVGKRKAKPEVKKAGTTSAKVVRNTRKTKQQAKVVLLPKQQLEKRMNIPSADTKKVSRKPVAQKVTRKPAPQKVASKPATQKVTRKRAAQKQSASGAKR